MQRLLTYAKPHERMGTDRLRVVSKLTLSDQKINYSYAPMLGVVAWRALSAKSVAMPEL
jgi:hypothetical protein